MLSPSPRERDQMTRRRSRVECALCAHYVDLARLRAHLREIHHLDSSRLDQILAEARRNALRGRSRSTGFTGV